MWLVLSFIACLASGDARSCRQVEIPWTGSLMQCMLRGQAEIARWERGHPGYHLSGGYSCGRGKQV